MDNNIPQAIQPESNLPDDMLQRHNIGGKVHKSHIRTPEEIIKSEEEFINRKLSPREREMVFERVKYLKEHEGHEAAHSEMLFIILGSLIVSQIMISLWKKYHPKSYNMSTLLGLWLIPMIMSLKEGYVRFLIFWTLFSIANGIVVKRALESPMQSSTPRMVYWWFQKVYDVSYFLGGIGYFIMIISFFHVPLAFGASLDGEADIFMTGMTIMFYALYFGTLGRDFVDRLSDIMATTMGYYSKSGFPRKHLRENMCAICGTTTSGSNEKLHSLNCNHTYHEICIRGWSIVGKKDVCPYCKEKVDLNEFKTNSWDTTQVFYLNLLDVLRYVLVWNPIVFFLIHYLIEWLGLK